MTTESRTTFWSRPPPLGTHFLWTQLGTSRGPALTDIQVVEREGGPISRWTPDPEADRVTVRRSTAEGAHRAVSSTSTAQSWTPIPMLIAIKTYAEFK
ncbi:hypothetical protein CgunFtcFv8_025078 [Champsocephalus gunnari]|uniref:Uncharacterized protein n=1 Tax=Champsocephalus gunnari TaxID=52237 RepID=A0AAN8HN29_CHAGU|nr:hypothetical protein CgunFtcFv8_025078 [Champsocephalus gunnari]